MRLLNVTIRYVLHVPFSKGFPDLGSLRTYLQRNQSISEHPYKETFGLTRLKGEYECPSSVVVLFTCGKNMVIRVAVYYRTDRTQDHIWRMSSGPRCKDGQLLEVGFLKERGRPSTGGMLASKFSRIFLCSDAILAKFFSRHEESSNHMYNCRFSR
jgi:hypothetical protein